MFPMSGGKTGLMGEAGPEAIMPLKRDKNGRLGVSVEGGSGSVVVNNNINVTGGSDPAAIRMEVAKLMPQITSATKAAVIDARRRGGQMRAAFSS
jgi:phage-related minor tail protein